MNILGKLLRVLFILCLPLLLITAGLAIPTVSANFYLTGFNRYDAGATTGLDQTALKAVAKGLVGYFNSSEEYINLTVIKDGQPFQVFNEREQVHLKDVKGLFRLDRTVLLGTGLYVIAYAVVSLFRRRRRPLAWSVVAGSSLTLGLMIALGIGMLFDFDQLLLQFHLLSFANDFWQLDPAHDYLVMLVTRGFMYDSAFICFGAAAGGAVVLGAAAGVYLFVTRRRSPASADRAG